MELACCYGTRKPSKRVEGTRIEVGNHTHIFKRTATTATTHFTQNVESKRLTLLRTLRKQKKSAKQCKDLNYSVGEMRLAGFTAKECKDAGFNTRTFLKQNGKEFEFYEFREVKDLGLSLEEYVKRFNFTPRELLRLGFTDNDILKSKIIEPNVLKAFQMKIKGKSLEDCKDAKLTARNCRDAGYLALKIYQHCTEVSTFKIGDEVVCWNQKSVSEVPGAASRVFRKSHFFGVVIDTIKLKNNATAHRVESDILGRVSWTNSNYLRDQTPQGQLNDGFGPDRLLKWR